MKNRNIKINALLVCSFFLFLLLCNSDTFGQTANIVYLEYFIDTDPGKGNGIGLPIAQDSIINENFSLDVTGYDVGFHKLCVRIKDSEGHWSQTNVFNIYVDEDPNYILPDRNIVFGEYFIDSDPGYGNGTPYTVTQVPTIDDIFQVTDVSDLDAGEHYLFFRVKDEADKWSHNNYVKFFLLDLKAWLEGPYEPFVNQMNSALNANDFLPNNHPYSTDPNATWYYEGIENVPSLPNNDIVDWILIETRDANNVGNAGSVAMDERQAAFITKDGRIVGLDGTSYPVFLEPIEQKLFVVLYHRNHLGIMNANEILKTGQDAYSYDYSISEDQVVGGSIGYKEISTGIWGMIAGDGDADGMTGSLDKNNVWMIDCGKSGYLMGDYNLNGHVNNPDKNDYWIPNEGKTSQIPQ